MVPMRDSAIVEAPHEAGSGTGILPVWADRLEALFHYARAVVVQRFNARNFWGKSSHERGRERRRGRAGAEGFSHRFFRPHGSFHLRDAKFYSVESKWESN